MLGKPAAENAAVDVNGQPVKLADNRGKVVVLALDDQTEPAINPSLSFRRSKRFKDQPLAVLAVHDASLTSLAKFRTALAPLRNQIAGEIPIRLLLDRRQSARVGAPPVLASEEEPGLNER